MHIYACMYIYTYVNQLDSYLLSNVSILTLSPASLCLYCISQQLRVHKGLSSPVAFPLRNLYGHSLQRTLNKDSSTILRSYGHSV